MSIRVVTDSACDLPQSLVDALGIEIVPAHDPLRRRGTRRPGGAQHRRVLAPARALASCCPRRPRRRPARSRPSSGSSPTHGATGIVCINLSSRLSATMQAAQVAAAAVVERLPDPGDRLAERARWASATSASPPRGAPPTATRPRVDRRPRSIDRRDRTKLFGTLDTLEFLKRGGRIGNARALLGSMLSIKPVIEVRDGVVEEAGKVRTRSKALQAPSPTKCRRAEVEHLAVLHGNAPDLDELLDLLDPIVPRRRHHHRDRRAGDRDPRRTPGHRRDLPGRAPERHNAAVELTSSRPRPR